MEPADGRVRMKPLTKVAPLPLQDKPNVEDPPRKSSIGDLLPLQDKPKFHAVMSSHNLKDGAKGLMNNAKKFDEGRGKVWDPHSPVMYRWDLIVAILLIYTAVVAPIEVVFSKDLKFNALFYINRLVDIGFVADLCLQFQLSYFSSNTGKWVVDRKEIALHYMRGWLILDILATTPWDLISFGIEKMIASPDPDADDSELGTLKLLRLLKILKLAKLLRLLKSMRIFDNIIEQVGMPYNIKSLMKYLAIMLVLVHLVACFWVFTREFVNNPECILATDTVSTNVTRRLFANERGRFLKGGNSAVSVDSSMNHCSWLDRLRSEYGDISDYDIYMIALEFALSVMCMGYGTSSPSNNTEWAYCVFCLFFAGSVYAYMVGAICACVQNEDPGVTEFKTNRDMLHKLCRFYSIDPEIRHSALDFYNFCKPVVLAEHQMESLKFLPENMRSFITFGMYGEWITKVDFFFSPAASDKEQRMFLMKVSSKIGATALPPREILYDAGDPIESMFIVNVGIFQCMAGGVAHWAQRLQIYTAGDYFGEEIVMQHTQARVNSVSTLTYCLASTLSRTDLWDVLDGHKGLFQNVRQGIRTVAIRISMTQKMRSIGVSIMKLKKHMGIPRMTKEDLKNVKEQYIMKAQNKANVGNKRSESRDSSDENKLIRGADLVAELRACVNIKDGGGNLKQFFSDALNTTEDEVCSQI